MDIFISNSSEKPIYSQIYSQIRDKILSGELKEGESLPSIRYLALELKVSVITTKRAYDELEATGLVDSVVGKGSFVRKQSTLAATSALREELDRKIVEIVQMSRKLGLSGKEVIDRFNEIDKESV